MSKIGKPVVSLSCRSRKDISRECFDQLVDNCDKNNTFVYIIVITIPRCFQITPSINNLIVLPIIYKKRSFLSFFVSINQHFIYFIHCTSIWILLSLFIQFIFTLILIIPLILCFVVPNYLYPFYPLHLF